MKQILKTKFLLCLILCYFVIIMQVQSYKLGVSVDPEIQRKNINKLFKNMNDIKTEIEELACDSDKGLDEDSLKLYMYYKIQGYVFSEEDYDPMEHENPQCIVAEIKNFQTETIIELSEQIDTLVEKLQSIFDFNDKEKTEGRITEFSIDVEAQMKFGEFSIVLQNSLKEYNDIIQRCNNHEKIKKTKKEKFISFFKNLKESFKKPIPLLHKKRMKEVASILCSLAAFCNF